MSEMKRLRERASARVCGVILDRAKLAVALLILGLVIGTCIGYGVLRIPQPRLMFDLMMLLTFISMLIWTIKKRHANEKDRRRE